VVFTGTTIRTLIRDRAPSMARAATHAPAVPAPAMRPAHSHADDHLFD